MIDFQTAPTRYRHWRLSFDGPIATLAMDVDEAAGLQPGYELKLNSYDLGVDIELYDAIQRLRFEHPEVGAVILKSAKPGVFCAGANIRMLGLSTHAHKVNFCKFTNETRNAIEDATRYSRQRYICVIQGTAAGGGYELALAADYIILQNDGTTSVALPEIPLLAVLPGTGGLTRIIDKRKIRRDRADFFCTVEEGVKGQRALEWRLVDELAPASQIETIAKQTACVSATQSDRPRDADGVVLKPLKRHFGDGDIRYSSVKVSLERELGYVNIEILGPQATPPATLQEIYTCACAFWPLRLARELDDLVLHLRMNETVLGLWVFKSVGNAEHIKAYDAILERFRDDWFVREVRLFLKRVFKRLDTSSRSLFTLIEPGSCFAGFLMEIPLASDRTYMLNGQWEDDPTPAAQISLSKMNFGALPMINDLTRLGSRFLDEPEQLIAARATVGQNLDARVAEALGLVTFIPDDIDWQDEVRLAIEERASFSPDALSGMEANLRFGGAETLESKIFGRLSAWQNWIFQRPNAAGERGALSLYGSGQRSNFDKNRV